MKKINMLLMAATICFVGCNSGSNNDSVKTADSANAKNDTTGMTRQSKIDTMQTPVNDDVAKFAVKVADVGMSEVQMGRLAKEKATSNKIREFGEMMIKDHTKANDELKTLAAEKNITLPAAVGSDTQKDIDDLSKTTGNDFDKAYINKMVSGHKDAIDDFQSEIKNTKDSAFKRFAEKTLPTLYKHLGSAEAIQKANHY